MRTTGESFFRLARRISAEHKEYFLELHAPNEARMREFEAEAAESLAAQAALEVKAQPSFADYLHAYFAQ